MKQCLQARRHSRLSTHLLVGKPGFDSLAWVLKQCACILQFYSFSVFCFWHSALKR